MFKKIIVLTLEEYKANWPIPTSADTQAQDKQLQMFIDDATNQIDNLCSGKLFRDWPKLDATKDEVVIYKLQRAVGDLTLLLDQTGKMFYNSNSQGGGNAPFSLSTRSDNSQVEWKRQDIIRNLIEAGFYENVRIGDNDLNVCDNEPTTSEIQDEFVRKLSQFFLRVDGSNTYNSKLMNFPNTCELNNTGDISGNEVQDKNTYLMRKPIISGYDIQGNSTNADYAKKIWDTKEEVYKFLSEFPISYFDGLTKQQIYNAIAASDKSIQGDITYVKGWVGIGVKDKSTYAWYESLVDENLGNTPPSQFPNAWKELPINPIEMDVIFQYIDDYLASLEKTKIKVEALGDIKTFKNQQDYEAYRDSFGLLDSDFEDVANEITPEQVAQIETNKNDISDLKTKVGTNTSNIQSNTNILATHTNDIYNANVKIEKNANNIAKKQDKLIAGENIEITDNGDGTNTIKSLGGNNGEIDLVDGVEFDAGFKFNGKKVYGIQVSKEDPTLTYTVNGIYNEGVVALKDVFEDVVDYKVWVYIKDKNKIKTVITGNFNDGSNKKLLASVVYTDYSGFELNVGSDLTFANRIGTTKKTYGIIYYTKKEGA